MINNLFAEKLTKQGVIFTLSEPMKDHTTFRVGGEADYYITVNSLTELQSVLGFCKEYAIPYMIIGNGSNLLVSDTGLRRAVIRLAGEFKELSVSKDTVKCGAGVTLAKLCTFALDNSLSGLEFAFGIPGTVGGAVYMNAGAYGKEMKDVLHTVTHLTRDGKVETLSAENLCLSYRHSIYKSNKAIVLSATFKLSLGDKPQIKELMDDIMNRRVSKQPLELPSAGSVFKRPEGAFAGTLIEQCGLKGTSVGGAQVSPKHAGFIVNTGGATCKDVTDLISLVQKTVKDSTGYILEREIIYLED